MAKLLIVYGTTEGQTRKIAERIAQRARDTGHEVALHDATALPRDLGPAASSAVIVAGSVHIGRHQSSIDHFVRTHRNELENRPSAFVSVSLSAAGDEHDRQDARECAEHFLAGTGWRPTTIHLAAGAFRFSQYDFFKRWIMRRIAREKGTPTDTGQDYEFTDWPALDRFVDDFLAGTTPGG